MILILGLDEGWGGGCLWTCHCLSRNKQAWNSQWLLCPSPAAHGRLQNWTASGSVQCRAELPCLSTSLFLRALGSHSTPLCLGSVICKLRSKTGQQREKGAVSLRLSGFHTFSVVPLFAHHQTAAWWGRPFSLWGEKNALWYLSPKQMPWLPPHEFTEKKCLEESRDVYDSQYVTWELKKKKLEMSTREFKNKTSHKFPMLESE